VLAISLGQPIVDRVDNNPTLVLQQLFAGGKSAIGLNDILRSIEKAKSDEHIKGIVLTNMEGSSASIATLTEVRNALLDFRLSGKFIVSYSEYYAQLPYYLATAADKIYMNPEGLLDLHGLGAGIMFYKGLFDKLGIEAQVIRHGKFKSAVEPYMYDKMSAENRAQILAYAGSIWNELVKGIAEKRQLTPERLNAMIDGLELNDADAALQNNLLDGLRQRSEVLDELATLTQLEANEKPKFIKVGDYCKTVTPTHTDKEHKVAVVYAEGEIVDDGYGGGIVGKDLADELRKIRRDTSIKAVVLRVNSPGGSAMASELIWHEMKLLKETRPVVVSMGGVAASGGYYIACPATAVVANPTTITGSIGVFGVLFNAQKLMNQKLGLTVDVAATNAHADMGSTYRPLTTAEYNYILHHVEKIYNTFTQHVADGRNIPQPDVDAIGQGRVWSGADAHRLKLVDELGGLNDAIEKAVLLANLETYSVSEFPRQKPTFELVMESINQASAKIFSKNSGNITDYEPLKSLLRNNRQVLMRLPYEVEMN
jgi:protease-4